MKTRNLLLTLTVAAVATLNVMAADALLSPRAADNQTKTVRGYSTDPDLTPTPGLASASPRVLDNQPKTVSGKSAAVASASKCTRHMACSPKMMDQCGDNASASMSCCSVAGAK